MANWISNSSSVRSSSARITRAPYRARSSRFSGLQYLNEVDIRPEDVSTASDFGQELVNLIFGEKSAAES